eukprot:TRINITY_DN4951_c0_g2_i2.p1 TRINITY_DN4951_c0_g2~~TRINITY_DN4951_c0_g2_i2.p1  ORF type:complete len:119 (+),score=17.83 TRINITY_DN4951_c0_g2_i2:265-621(+)
MQSAHLQTVVLSSSSLPEILPTVAKAHQVPFAYLPQTLPKLPQTLVKVRIAHQMFDGELECAKITHMQGLLIVSLSKGEGVLITSVVSTFVVCACLHVLGGHEERRIRSVCASDFASW